MLPEHLLFAIIRKLLVIVLGRLAVDFRWQGSGIGSELLKDAVMRALSVAQEVGVRSLLVHALGGGYKPNR